MSSYYHISTNTPTPFTPIIGQNLVVKTNFLNPYTFQDTPLLPVLPGPRPPLQPIVPSDPPTFSPVAPPVTTQPVTAPNAPQTDTQRNGKIFAYSLLQAAANKPGQDYATLRTVLSREYNRAIDAAAVSADDINYVKTVLLNFDSYAKGYPLAVFIGELIDQLIQGKEPAQALQIAKNNVDGNTNTTTPGDPKPTPTPTPGQAAPGHGIEYGKIAATVIIGFLFKQAIEAI